MKAGVVWGGLAVNSSTPFASSGVDLVVLLVD